MGLEDDGLATLEWVAQELREAGQYGRDRGLSRFGTLCSVWWSGLRKQCSMSASLLTITESSLTSCMCKSFSLNKKRASADNQKVIG